MESNLYAKKVKNISKNNLEVKFKEILEFLENRIIENKPLLPPPKDEEIQVYELDFHKVKTFHFDISRALLKEAKILANAIKIPGCGDSKTIATMILCSVSIEATLNYVIRYCMHLLGYGEEEVYQFLWQLPIKIKVSLVEKYFKDDKDYKHGFKFLYNRVKEGVEDWAYVGYIRDRLIHHKGDIVHMSISQAKAVISITEKIINKFTK
jgi:hypothetical protein